MALASARRKMTVGPQDIRGTQMSMVTFVAAFLEHLCMLAGTTEIRAGYVFGKYLVEIGEHRFEGDTPEQAHMELIKWMQETPAPPSREFFDEQAGEVIEQEKKESEELIEELIKDGMTDFGKKVEEHRQKRRDLITQALSEILTYDTTGELGTFSLCSKVKEKTTLDDVTVKEIMEILQNTKMKG